MIRCVAYMSQGSCGLTQGQNLDDSGLGIAGNARCSLTTSKKMEKKWAICLYVAAVFAEPDTYATPIGMKHVMSCILRLISDPT